MARLPRGSYRGGRREGKSRYFICGGVGLASYL
jgi:hypothetical protein